MLEPLSISDRWSVHRVDYSVGEKLMLEPLSISDRDSVHRVDYSVGDCLRVGSSVYV